jgi:hypothetical protein
MGVLAHSYNASAWQDEAEELQVQSQPERHREPKCQMATDWGCTILKALDSIPSTENKLSMPN